MSELMIVGEAVGVSELYIAKITKDKNEAAGYTTATPELLAPMATIGRETTVNTKTRYYSNKALFVDSSEGETKISPVVPGLTVKKRNELLGKDYDATSGLGFDDGQAKAPYYALGYAIDRPDNVKEFHWFLKGKFSIPKDEGETKTDNVNEKTLGLEFVAVTTQHKFKFPTGEDRGCKAVSADTTDSNFAGAATWFASVQKPPEPTAP